MYKPYSLYIKKYFPNAEHIVDSFHVVQLINRYFLAHIRKVQRNIDANDRARHAEYEQEFGRTLLFTHSKEYLLLKKYHWMLLKNRSNLKFYQQPRYNHLFKKPMNTHDYMKELFSLNPSFRTMYDLKEKYIEFNNKYAGNPKTARLALEDLIALYRKSDISMFLEIADTIERHFEAILNSFIMAKRCRNNITWNSRLSNGPIEALNRIPKDLKRIGRGYLNPFRICAIVSSFQLEKMLQCRLLQNQLTRFFCEN